MDEFLLSLAASGASASTIRSYAYDLLRWWRWLTTNTIGWNTATRTDVRDLVLWMQQRRPAGAGLGPATINHCLAVLSSFYDEHVRAGNVSHSPAQRRATTGIVIEVRWNHGVTGHEPRFVNVPRCTRRGV